MSTPGGIRSSRSRSRAFCARTSTRSRRSPSPRPSTICCVSAWPGSRRPRATRSPSRRRSGRRRSRSFGARGSRRTRSTRPWRRMSSSGTRASCALRIPCSHRCSTGASETRGGASTRGSRRFSTIRSCEPGTSRCRPKRRSRDAAELVFGAATLALERGAAAVSAELAEHALRLTPADAPNERRRRALAAAHANQAAGEWTRARSLATDVLGATEAGPWRAQALVLLAELAGAEDSAALLEEALEAARDDPALRSAIYCRLAWAARFRSGVDYAGQALALAEQLGDDVLQARARVVQAVLGWFHGEPAAGRASRSSRPTSRARSAVTGSSRRRRRRS